MNIVKKLIVFLSIVVLLASTDYEVNAEQRTIDYDKPDDIIVVLDVSGSMASTDAERLSFETIELLLKLGDPEDRIGVVAFNETIVYLSNLTKVENKQAVESVLSDIEKIPYRGDTDNGLGLSTGLELLTKTEQSTRNQAIIFISDGKIDLPNPIGGRTEEDSRRDMEESIAIAIERNIPIYTFGFSASEPEIADELTAIAAATKGLSYICKGPLQMMNNVLDIAMLYKNEYSGEKISVKPNADLQKYELELDEKTKSCIIFQVSGQLEDFEVVAPGITYETTGTKHCRVISFGEKQSGKITLCYRTQKESNAIISDIRFEIEEPEPVKEEVKPDKPAPQPKPIEPVQEPEDNNDGVIWIAILALSVLTVCICAGIVYAFFRKKKVVKPQAVLEGYLYANFIDLKSKNDIPAAIWNLKDYPPEGVTLKELFIGNGIHEDLPQLDQICLYPDEDGNGLTLVHCTDGGIFIDDKTVSKNVPAHVRFGETIYVAFPENASEFSLKYKEKKEEIEKCM